MSPLRARILSIFLCCVICFMICAVPVSATPTSAEIQALEKQAKEIQNEINALKKKAADQTAIKNAIDKQIANTQAQIDACNNQIRQYNQQIAENQAKIDAKYAEIEQDKIDFKKRIRAIYMSNTDSPVQILLGASSFSDYLELAQMTKSAGLDLKTLEPESADSPFGQYTGAGTIFGASGGVAEAAARTAYYLVTGKNIEDIEGMRGVMKDKYRKEVELDIAGTKVKICVVSTLKEAEKAVQEVKNGTADFQLLEVMACPGGCVNGGGQPISCNTPEKREKRAQGLYMEDANVSKCRHSHDNTDVKRLYDEYLGEPNSHTAHEWLHTHYTNNREKLYISVGE